MVDTFGMTGMIVLALLVLIAIYIIMRLIGRPGSDEDEGEGSEEQEKVVHYPENAGQLSDEEFIDSYTGPILEDALETMEMAVGSIGSGVYFYGEGRWESAGEDLHSAVGKLDEAAEKLREIPGMVEDTSLAPVVKAKARMDECRRLRALAIRMEEACDAMVEGRADEAKKLDAVKPELEKLVDEWKR